MKGVQRVAAICRRLDDRFLCEFGQPSHVVPGLNHRFVSLGKVLGPPPLDLGPGRFQCGATSIQSPPRLGDAGFGDRDLFRKVNRLLARRNQRHWSLVPGAHELLLLEKLFLDQRLQRCQTALVRFFDLQCRLRFLQLDCL